MSNKAIEIYQKRRTQYALGKNLDVSNEQIIELVKEAVRQAPSSFNSQSSRAVILLGEQSELFWELTKEALRPLVPADAFVNTENKLASFAAGAGTVLFFEDQDVVKGLQEQFASYADNFPIWSEQSSGIAQFAVWTALADAGIGASLQHYNPVVDAAVAETWDIPASWTLRAQMPFGSNEAGFGEKTFMEDEQRFRVFV
ncbi:MAG TPA: nitroreductase family protein [Candidatus Pseudomonas excrementavium]|uniref:nitroreductase family protein n=1 Tax=Halopseudomonas bauzanensis TaxID=653930 RepID=UPI001C39891E|nr:nitroreductase family protein [Halopseudomonas bauzanensis]HIZ51143.1 nitroreductase family protein [Candidatus Pseudomonas excrementavium]